MQAVVMGTALRQAQDRYYMANGKYALDMRDLDVNVSAGCTMGENGAMVSCKEFYCTINDNWENAESKGTAYCDLRNSRKLMYEVSPYWGATRFCVAISRDATAQKVCMSMGGVYKQTINNADYYVLP